MGINKSSKTGGILFIASGTAFVAAALIGQQPALFGVAAMFITLGFAFIQKSKREPKIEMP